MAASAGGSAKVVKMLLENGGVDIINNIQARPKYTAAHEAAKRGHLEVLTVCRQCINML